MEACTGLKKTVYSPFVCQTVSNCCYSLIFYLTDYTCEYDCHSDGFTSHLHEEWHTVCGIINQCYY